MQEFITRVFRLLQEGKIAPEAARALLEHADSGTPRVETSQGYDQADGNSGIIITGMSARFPGASTLEQFWANLSSGFDAVGGFPRSRAKDVVRAKRELWQRYEEQLDTRSLGSGAFLDSVCMFDPDLFSIPPAEAELMPPAHRLMLTVAAEALVDAGLELPALAGQRVGVFIGYSPTPRQRYDVVLDGSDPRQEHLNLDSMLAARVAYTFGTSGPALVVDTTCSSSLVALHLAARSLRSGDIDIAVVGGVNLCTFPLLSERPNIGAESAGARVRAFDEAADGTNFGEGVCAIVLERDSTRADAKPYAAYLGSAVNSDGRSSSITAPNPAAQRDVIVAALRDAGLTPDEVRYVESHGTGTKLGDPIEIQALKEAFSGRDASKERCLIGALKPSIGHLDAAAGLASVIKVALSLARGSIPPILHLRRPNPLLGIEGSSLELCTTERSWSGAPHERVAGISAFGLSGTNAHVLIRGVDSSIDLAQRPRLKLHERRIWPALAVKDESKSEVPFYQIEWHGAATSSKTIERDSLICAFLDDGVVSHSIARAVEGMNVVVVRHAAESNSPENTLTVNIENPGWVTSVIERLRLVAGNRSLRIVYGWSAGSAGLARGIMPLFDLVKEASDVPGLRLDVVALTSRAMKVLPDECPVNPIGATCFGLLRVVSQEYPRVRTRVIDVAEALDGESLKVMSDELLAADLDSDQFLAVRDAALYRPLLAAASEHVQSQTTEWFRPASTYVIIGGTGFLGQHIARDLASRGACHIVFVSRKGPAVRDLDPLRRRSMHDTLELLAARGATHELLEADVTSPCDVNAVITALAERTQVQGVYFAVKEIYGRKISELSRDEFRRALDNRIVGLEAVVEAVRAVRPTFLLVIGSISTIFGGPGNADCASVNCYLDSRVWSLGQEGIHASVVNLTEVATEDKAPLVHQEHYLPAISYSEFIGVLDRALAGRHPFVVASKFDLDVLAKFAPVMRVHFGRGFERTGNAMGTTSERSSKLALPPLERLEEQLIRAASQTLGVDRIDAGKSFFDAGGDSISVIKLLELVRNELGIDVNIGMIYEYPSMRALARELSSSNGRAEKEPPGEPVELDQMLALLARGEMDVDSVLDSLR